MSTPRPDSLPQEALLLRAFALSLFTGRVPSEGLLARACEASEQSWTLFLTAEACAVPLARALRDRGVGGAVTLPDRVRAAIAQREQIELQRIMIGRWQLDRIDELSAAAGIQPCVIKGGVLLGDAGRSVDLGDIDLLVRPEEADAACEVMRRLGMAQHGGDAMPDALHLAPFEREGMLPVEIHTRLLYGARRMEIAVEQRAIGGRSALRQWAGPNAVLGMLVHSLEIHPHRCGHVRDLLVLAAALEGFGAGTARTVDEWIAGSDAPATMAEVLQLARAIQRGEVAMDSPRLRGVAAQKYADLLVPPSARFARFVAARPRARYLPALVPRRALAQWLWAQIRAAWRSPPAQLREVIGESRPARMLGGAATVLWRSMWLALTLVEGVGARRRARREVAGADRRLGDAR